MDIFMMRNTCLHHCQQVPITVYRSNDNFLMTYSVQILHPLPPGGFANAINGPYKEFTRPMVYSKNNITKQGNVNVYLIKKIHNKFQ